MNFNEWKKLQAEKLGAVVSHDAPEPGEGLHGEHMSPLPNSSGDFPSPGHVDLGKVHPDGYRQGSLDEGPVGNLPTSVSAQQVRRESLKRDPYSQGGEQ